MSSVHKRPSSAVVAKPVSSLDIPLKYTIPVITGAFHATDKKIKSRPSSGRQNSTVSNNQNVFPAQNNPQTFQNSSQNGQTGASANANANLKAFMNRMDNTSSSGQYGTARGSTVHTPVTFSNLNLPLGFQNLSDEKNGGGNNPASARNANTKPGAPMKPSAVGLLVTNRNSISNNTGGTITPQNIKSALANSLGVNIEKEKDIVLYSDPTRAALVVRRSVEEKASNSERLNLDRRGLVNCCVLEGEESLRLLNYESNVITSISNMVRLPSLIFLDLYNNQIKEISGLSDIPTLRVLMLGKNQIKKIENLEMLKDLDVLDLHSNKLKVVENLGHARKLRVLNLAGNQIRNVDSTALANLSALQELNLRRNQISSIGDLQQLVFLERLYCSHNVLDHLKDIQFISKLPSLIELTLEYNPVTSDKSYKSTVLSQLPTLKKLDQVDIFEADRIVANLASKIVSTPVSTATDNNPVSNIDTSKEPPTIHKTSKITNSIQKEMREAQIRKIEKQFELDQKNILDPDVLLEIDEKESNVSIYGPALNQLTEILLFSNSLSKSVLKPSLLSSLISLTLYCISIDNLIEIFPALSRILNLRVLVLGNNKISHLYQLEPFMVLPKTLEELSISPNPICTTAPVQYRSFLYFLLPLLKSIDSVSIDLQQPDKSVDFESFRRLWSNDQWNMCKSKLAWQGPNAANLKGTAGNTMNILNKKLLSQMQSKNRKIARTLLDKISTDVIKLDETILSSFNSIFANVVSNIEKRTHEYNQDSDLAEQSLDKLLRFAV